MAMAPETERRSPPEPEAPAGLAWLPWIGHQIAREWPVIKSAPLSFVFVAVLSATLGVAATIVFYSERISIYDARDQYVTGQLADYKSAFPGKSPDEAAKEVAGLRGALGDAQKHLDTLEKAVSLAEDQNKKEIAEIRKQLEDSSKHPFAPWVLNPTQRAELGKALDEQGDKKFPIAIRCLIGSSQSQSFTQSIIDVFSGRGWSATANCMGGLKTDLVGVSVVE